MTADALTLAVVGHTNTGKTSLLRTLTRDVDFGEISARPATTRHVEGSSILLGSTKVMELFDTPGLEDSIGLLDHLDQIAGDRRADGLEVIKKFLASRKARGRFAQEAKAIRQVLDSDVALYVVDARDRVLGKHRDELEILARCATPVVPVLNFTAHPDAQVPVWRDHLARANMHVVAEFDTVVLDEESEQRLYEKMRTVADSHAEALTALIDDRRRLRMALIKASAELTADLLIDAAAYVDGVPVGETEAFDTALDELRQRVRAREQQCVDQLLELHQFRREDYQPQAPDMVDGRWGLDLFSQEAMKQFGLKTGSAAATGALLGLMVDAMVGGASLGAATAAGATVGGLWGAGRMHGKRLMDRVRGTTELRCDDVTLRVLALRQIMLIRSLLRRGHAAMDPVTGPSVNRLEGAQRRSHGRLPSPMDLARIKPRWSHLMSKRVPPRAADPARAEARDALARVIAEVVRRPPDAELTFP